MGICDSKNCKKSQIHSKESTTTFNITPIIKNNKNKKCKTITFWDTNLQQNDVISDQKSYSPPPKLCFYSTNQCSNIDTGQLNESNSSLKLVIQNKQSKQTLFGKTLKFSNSSRRWKRDLLKHLPSNQ